MEFKVSISNDLAIPNLLGVPIVTMHDYLGPIPPAPMAYAPIGGATELPVPMFWPPGMAMGQNKLSTKTLHKNLPICQGGHDCGVLIPHLQIVPSVSNTLTVLHIAFSGRSSVFQSSTVLTDGKPTAACTLINLPPAPMVTCMDPVSLPVGSAPTSHLNTMTFGMSLADYIIAAATVLVTMAVEFAVSRIPGPDPTGLADALAGKLVPSFVGWAAKSAVGLASGAAQLIFTDGPAALTLGVGSPYLKVEAKIERNADGEYVVGAGSQIVSTQGEVSYNTTTGVTSAKVAGGDPTGSSEVGASSDKPGEAQTGSTSHSMNPSTWGAPL